MDFIFIVFIVKLLTVAFLIAAIPLLLYFEIAYRLKGNITNPMVKGIVVGLIWGILFTAYTVHRSSAVGAAMAGPVILICFPIIGLIVGTFYEKRKKPLIVRKQKTNI